MLSKFAFILKTTINCDFSQRVRFFTEFQNFFLNGFIMLTCAPTCALTCAIHLGSKNFHTKCSNCINIKFCSKMLQIINAYALRNLAVGLR